MIEDKDYKEGMQENARIKKEFLKILILTCRIKAAISRDTQCYPVLLQ